MTKRYPSSYIVCAGLVLLTLLVSLLLTIHVASVSYAADHVPLTEYGQFPKSVVGKLIIQFTSSTRYCSGTALLSDNESVVDTAAHCFFDPNTKQRVEANKIQFCPQYKPGGSAYGCWTGKKLFVSPNYKKFFKVFITSSQYDYGFLVVSPQFEQNGTTKTLGSVVLGVQPTFSSIVAGEPVTAYGYPKARSNGMELYSVNGENIILHSLGSTGAYLEFPKYDLGDGASGGPWFVAINGTTYLIGHATIFYNGSEYSPILSGGWSSLFSEAKKA